MLTDADGSSAKHARSKPYTNGKSQPASSAAATANGTHKTALSNGSKPRHPEKYFGHNREEVTRILIQALSDMGYHTAAQNVSEESGFELESPTVANFRTAVLDGDWDEAESLLDKIETTNESGTRDHNILALAGGADRTIMRFWIRQQKFLELLEQQEHGRALMVLRMELTPLFPNTQKLQFLSSLIMCGTREELRSKADWDGADGRSRHILLSELSKCISPAVMLPEHRLAGLLQQVKESQIGGCLWHSSAVPPSLYCDHACDRHNFPTEPVIELDDHEGEVWHVVFSHDGSKLASCGGDKQVIIWDVPSFRVLHCLSDHDAGVGNVAWSWDDSMLVTCSQDKHARLWNTETGTCMLKLERLEEPVSSCIWAADNRSFITGSLDLKKSLVQWDLDGNKIYDWRSPHRVEDLAASPDGRWLVAMDSENHIHVYNLATRELEYKMDLKARLTSLSMSYNSRHLLVNQKNGIAQLIDLVLKEPIQQYTGHKGGEYLIRSSLGGADENFVNSGSEDGYINIWHKASAQPIEKLMGHSPRTNAVAWCPSNPCLFASCGDDGKIKIWSNENWRRSHMESLQQR